MRLAFVVLLALVPATVSAQTHFAVTNLGLSAYRIGGVSNPTLELTRGQTYIFDVNAPGHPFYVKTVRIAGTGSQFTTGVSGQGTNTVTFVVPMSAPNTLFYQCSFHDEMGGTLNIKDAVGVEDLGDARALWLAPAAPNPARDGASFRFGLPRRARVALDVFDLRGRRVARLTDADLPAGEHVARWDGRDAARRPAAAGLYLARLEVQGVTRVARFVVTR